MKLNLLIMILIALVWLSGVVSAYNIEGGGVCNCNACPDCTNAGADTGDCYTEVKLTADITDQATTCINDPDMASGAIFNCQKHWIDGTNAASSYGFYIEKNDGVVIKNCNVTQFERGVYIKDSDSGTISDNNITFCTYNIYLDSKADNNIVDRNRACNSSSYDIYNLDANSGDNNSCHTAYNWNDDGTSGCTTNCVGVPRYVVYNTQVVHVFLNANDLNNNVVETSRTGEYPVLGGIGNDSTANFTVLVWLNFTDNIDFLNFTAGYDLAAVKSFFDWNGTCPPEIINESLLIPRVKDTSRVYVCPNAISLSDVYKGCPDEVIIVTGETRQGMTVSEVTTAGKNYYKVTGVTGTGGGEDAIRLDFVPPTPENNTEQAYANINISIIEQNLDTFKWNWNTTDYEYDPLLTNSTGIYNLSDTSLVLAMTFNNMSVVGESYTSPSTDDTIHDYSGGSNDGITKGSIIYNPAGGKYAGAFEFDGSSDFINISDSASLSPTNEISIVLWAKQDSVTSDKALITKWEHDTQDTWYIQVFGTALEIAIADNITDRGAKYGYPASGTWTVGWTHVAVVYDGSGATNADKLKLYQNGTELAMSYTGTIDSSLTDSTAPVKIGSFSGTFERYWNGVIDDVHIYNRALTADEISARYYSNLWKYNLSQWYFGINMVDQADGTYTYYGWANDTGSTENNTETRIVHLSAAVCYCDSCSSCTNQINNVSCDLVHLTQNISTTTTCINDPAGFTDKVFDCQGYKIDGDDGSGDYGFYLNNQDGNVIRNCVITDFGRGIYAAYSAEYNNFTDNEITSCTFAGIFLDYGADHTNIINNTLNNDYYGFLSRHNVQYVNVINNTARYNADTGIEPSLTARYFHIENNIVEHNNLDGIFVYDLDDSNITNNRVYNNSWSSGEGGWGAGIRVQNLSDRNNISNNNVSGNRRTGILFQYDSNEDNIIENNIVCGNNLSAGYYYDIYDNDSATNNTGDDNECNTTYNYNDTGTVGCTYSCIPGSCYCSGCGDCEERLNDTLCNEVKLDTNIINHSGTCIDDPANFENKTFDCLGNTIDGDDNEFPPYFGIYLINKTNNTIKNCIVTDFTWGIFFGNSSNSTVHNNTANSNIKIGLAFGGSSDNNITNNTANLNGWEGIALEVDSTGNLVNNNTVCNNNQVSGPYKDLYDADANTGDDNTCNTVYNWNDTGTTGCTYPCPGIVCGQTITTDTTLTEDLICPENGLIFGASNIKLDCNYYNITGGGSYTGLNISGYDNNEITNCYMPTNFATNIYISDSNNTLLNFSETTGDISWTQCNNKDFITKIHLAMSYGRCIWKVTGLHTTELDPGECLFTTADYSDACKNAYTEAAPWAPDWLKLASYGYVAAAVLYAIYMRRRIRRYIRRRFGI